MTLTELTRAVGNLRNLPALERRAAVVELQPELANLFADERVAADTRVNLVTRALRAIAPRAPRPSNPDEAFVALQMAIDADRKPGRPAEGSPHTIRVPDEVWNAVRAKATAEGVSESKAAAMLLADGLAGNI